MNNGEMKHSKRPELAPLIIVSSLINEEQESLLTLPYYHTSSQQKLEKRYSELKKEYKGYLPSSPLGVTDRIVHSPKVSSISPSKHSDMITQSLPEIKRSLSPSEMALLKSKNNWKNSQLELKATPIEFPEIVDNSPGKKRNVKTVIPH